MIGCLIKNGVWCPDEVFGKDKYIIGEERVLIDGEIINNHVRWFRVRNMMAEIRSRRVEWSRSFVVIVVVWIIMIHCEGRTR